MATLASLSQLEASCFYHPQQGSKPSTHTHMLTSSSFICNLCRSLDDPITLAFCMPAKPHPCGQHQDLPMASDVTRLYEPSAAIASECLNIRKQIPVIFFFFRAPCGQGHLAILSQPNILGTSLSFTPLCL